MIPTIQIEEGRFAGVARRDADGTIEDGVRLAQVCLLEEILGAVFGAITLWYLVNSIAGLA